MHLKMAECGLQMIVHLILGCDDLIGLFNTGESDS